MKLWRRKSIQARVGRQRAAARRTPAPEARRAPRDPSPAAVLGARVRGGMVRPPAPFFSNLPLYSQAHAPLRSQLRRRLSLLPETLLHQQLQFVHSLHPGRRDGKQPPRKIRGTRGQRRREKERDSTRRRAHAPPSRGPRRHAQAAPPAPGEQVGGSRALGTESRAAPWPLCLRLWKSGSLRNLAHTKCFRPFARLADLCVQHRHLKWMNYLLSAKLSRPLFKSGNFHPGEKKKKKPLLLFFSLENSVEKMETVRWELPHHAMSKSTN